MENESAPSVTDLGLGSVIDGFIGYHGIIGRNPANELK